MTRIRRQLLVIAMIVSSSASGIGTGTDRQFVDQLSDGDRSVLGIDEMTAEQVAVLEAAVQRYVVSRSEKATEDVRDAMAEEISRRDALLSQTKQQLEETKTALNEMGSDAKESFLDRAKVFLRPGTQVEYTKLESSLEKPFSGWRTGMIFQLQNGQMWQVVEGEYWVPTQPAGKKVTVVPGMFGSFFLEIEGVRQRVKVKIVSR
jgi:hypothetical protein